VVRKGFYFSFDAFLALSVMAATLAMVSQSSVIASNNFQVSNIDYKKSTTTGQDAMKLASQQNFYSFNSSFRQELKDETVMTESDFDRTIIDGVSLLWAARNFSHAEEVAQKYFDSKVPESYDYRLEVNQDNTTVIYKTSDMPNNPETVSSISRLVSGHRIDRPSEGFQARARAVEATTNQTKVVNIPMMGSGAYTNKLEVNRSFYIPASKIRNSTMYLSMKWGQSNFDSATVEINGQSAIEKSDMDIDESGKAHYGFGKVNVAEYVEPGWNSFNVIFPNQDSKNNYHAQFQPGTRIETVYTQDVEKVKSRDWEYLTDVFSEASNNNNKGGVWYNYPLQVPKDADVDNATLQLDIRNLEDHRKDDLQVYLNDELIHNESAPVNEIMELEFSDKLKPKTNVLSIYGNVKLDGSSIEDFTHTGSNGPGPRIYSDPINEEGSRIKLSYESPGQELEFGLIELTWTNEIGSDITESLNSRSNPAYFNHTFDEKFDIINTYLNVVQRNSINVTHRAGIDSQETVYESSRTRANPSKIETGPELVSGGNTTEYGYKDTCYDGQQRNFCEVLPESSIEIQLGLPSQVGYGELFENESDAVKNANQRLEEQLGKFAEATEIEHDTASTGNQPYLWGPASVRLVIWRE